MSRSTFPCLHYPRPRIKTPTLTLPPRPTELVVKRDWPDLGGLNFRGGLGVRTINSFKSLDSALAPHTTLPRHCHTRTLDLLLAAYAAAAAWSGQHSVVPQAPTDLTLTG